MPVTSSLNSYNQTIFAAARRGWVFCAAENPSSARLMKRAGMTREGVLHRWQVFPNLGPVPRDCLFCAKVK